MSTRASRRGGLGRYRYIMALGEGGMAEVWLAEDASRSLRVIKELKEEFARQGEFRQMFADEASVAVRLEHPNIVKTYEVAEADGHRFLVMEYLDGQPLDVVARLRDCPLRLRLSIIDAVLAGVDYTHRCTDGEGRPLQIVHRDLSPKNIFVTYEGRVKILDFGIAKAVTRTIRSRVGDIKGTVAYMAPEQVRGESVEDHRADLFTVGVLLWEAIAQRSMWAGLSDVAVLNRLGKGAVPPIADHWRADTLPDQASRMPAQLVQLVDDSLAAAPERRPSSAAEMRERLLPVLHALGGVCSAADIAPWMVSKLGESRVQVRAQIQEARRPSGVPPPLPKRKHRPDRPPSALAEVPSSTLTEELLVALDGPYEVIRPFHHVADSGFIEVQHRQTRAKFIVKLKAITSDPNFLDQAPTLAVLRHPNTVRLMDFGRLVDRPYFFAVHERFSGVTLQTAVTSDGLFSSERALKVLRQLLSSLAEAHDTGIVHGRLSPARVFLVDGNDDWIKVLGYDAPAGTPASTAQDLATVARLYRYMATSERAVVPAPIGSFLMRLEGQTESFGQARDALRGLAEVESTVGISSGVLPLAPSHTSVVRSWTHRLMSTRKPSVWAFDGDPALDRPEVKQALRGLESLCSVRWLDEQARRDAGERLQNHLIDPPWVFLFGDLHVLLNDPLIAVMSSIGEVSRLLISTHANAELLESTINHFGLDLQICLPSTEEDIQAGVRRMIDRTRRLQHHYDDVRLALHWTSRAAL